MKRGKTEGRCCCFIPKANDSVSTITQHAEDVKDALVITEGTFGKPVTRSGRWLNANHPPKDATKEELKAIARFWGNPDDVKPIKVSRAHGFDAFAKWVRRGVYNGLTPPKIVRDAYLGSGSSGKLPQGKRHIDLLYPPDDLTKEEMAELEAEWGDPDDVIPLRDRNNESHQRTRQTKKSKIRKRNQEASEELL